MQDRNLTYSERWFLAYGETFDEFHEKNSHIIPACDLEERWDNNGIPKTTKELKEVKWKID